MPKNIDINSVITWLTKNYQAWYVGLSIAVIIAIIAMLIGNSGFMRDIEQQTLDYRFVHFPIPEQADTNIVLVDIDNNSLDYFAEKVGIQYPFPRSFYAQMNNLFAEVGTRSVMYDMLFYDPDLNRDETYAEETDGAFAASIREHGQVILGAELLADTAKKTPSLGEFGFQMINDGPEQDLTYRGAKAPIDTLLNATTALGVTNVRTDRGGVLRHVQLFHEYQGKIYANLPVRGWLAEIEMNPTWSKGAYRIGGRRIPVDDDGEYLVNWYGAGGPDGVFRYVPISAVIQTASALRYGGEPALNPEMFRDKYIIVGASAAGLKDLKPTPFTGISAYPGMEIWAMVLSNLTQGDFVHVVSWWVNFLNTLLVSFLAFMIFTRFQLRYSNLMMVGILAYIIGIAISVWVANRAWLGIITPVTGFVLSYITIATLSFVVEGRSKLEIRKVFSRYVHPDVIQNLLKDPELVQMGGDEIYATVLFSDIYNFTTFSEGKTAPELVQYLNEYFDTLTSFVLDHNGLLDKYTGDGIMALFGAPVPRDDHAYLASQAALAHRDYSLKLREKYTELPPAVHFHLNTRIGLNSGPIVAGNIGSERRADYTAIGDDVNLAARLEGVNKVFKTKIIISESTFELVKEHFICRELDMLRVKGKTEPVKIYELIDYIGRKPEYNMGLYYRYHEGLFEYRNGNWRKAIKIFEELADGDYQDSPSQTMYERSKLLKKQRPNDWDGVFTLQSK
ncbi:MAG: Adenylate cyclase 2 [Candidatus Marinimicrobia bacterium]|nr:Adenylate cyclase 2 [Candidatus Neomarinimicrobiota bacterium]